MKPSGFIFFSSLLPAVVSFLFFPVHPETMQCFVLNGKTRLKKKKTTHKNKLHRIAWDFSFSQKKRNDCGDFSARFSQKPLSPCCFVFPSLACRVSFPSVTTQNPAAIFVVEDGRPSLRGHGKQHYPPHRFYNALINPGVVASLV